MSAIKLKGNEIHTSGHLPEKGALALEFKLTRSDLNDVVLEDFAGKRLILNVFPSIDTPVCAASVRRFNQEAGRLSNCVVLCISRDLPFAHARFCGAEGIANVVTLSEFRVDDFGLAYGLKIVDGPLTGLFSRSVIILDESHRIIYTEQVPEIGQEPDYTAALNALNQ